jgi:putative membrane fusion protein
MAKAIIKRNKIILYLFLSLVGVLFVILYVIPAVTGALTPTTLIEYGSIQTIDKAEVLIVRSEKLVAADTEGDLTYYFEDGEYLRKGAKILDIAGSETQYVAEQSGFVSYYCDGLEKDLTPATMREFSRSTARSLKSDPRELERKKTETGEPLYKLVNDRLWYAVFWVDQEAAIHYQKDKTVTLRLPEASLPGKVHYIGVTGDVVKIIIEFDRYYENLSRLRREKAEIVSADLEGLMVANESITSREGKPGVFVRNVSGQFEFVRVAVIISDGRFSLVENTYFSEKAPDGTNQKVPTVEVYDEILNHPEKEKAKP